MEFPGFDLNHPQDCAAASALNDRFIHRYMGLLDRFSELPACEDLVYNQVKGEFPKDYLESLSTFSCLPPPGDPMMDDENQQQPDSEDDQEQEQDPEQDSDDAGEDQPPAPGEEDDAQLPEEMRLMRTLERRGRMMIASVYQIMFDWCNLYAIVVPAEQRREALQVLVLLGLFLGNLNSSMDQLACFQTTMAIHLCTRARDNNRAVCELLIVLMDKCQSLKQILDSRVKSLHALDSELQEHINICKKLGDQERPY